MVRFVKKWFYPPYRPTLPVRIRKGEGTIFADKPRIRDEEARIPVRPHDREYLVFIPIIQHDLYNEVRIAPLQDGA